MNCQHSHKLFLVGIPTSATENQLVRFFGNVLQGEWNFTITLKKKQKNAKNCGCAIISLTCETDYNKILHRGRFFFQGRQIFVKLYLNKKERNVMHKSFTERKVFIKGLPRSTTSIELFDFFNNIFPLEDAYVVEGNNTRGNSLKYGFLVFQRKNDAKNILSHEGLKFKGFKIVLSPYRTKEEKRRQEMKKRFGKKTKKIQYLDFYKNENLTPQLRSSPSGLKRKQFYLTENKVLIDISKVTRYNQPTEVLSHYDLQEIFLLQRGMKTYSEIQIERQRQVKKKTLRPRGQEKRNMAQFARFSGQSRPVIEDFYNAERGRELNIVQEVPEEDNHLNFNINKESGKEKKRYIPKIDFCFKDRSVLSKVVNGDFKKYCNHYCWNLRLN